ncbi:MAG: acyl-CoA dehydrogenase family protein [Arenicellales bacterium]|nr:acyl-CoA dehydrogenase family protein [Arenicellales bacterium]
MTNHSNSDSLRVRLTEFMERYVYPAEQVYADYVSEADNPWTIPPVMEELKNNAKTAGLWNLWCPYPEHGAGLDNAGYAPLAEIMGRSLIGPEAFNCSAPDTGNMETLLRFGTDAQKEMWLKPLLAGEIRSAFCMTEPDVASSDATNIQCSIKKEGNEYVIDGLKWWSTGAMDPRCQILIVMGKTDTNAERHKQQSMVLVAMDTPGVHVVRPMHVFGSDDAPHGHAEIEFNNVRVSTANILAGEGRGFEIAQARLGPGRIHHCMRLIGCAQRGLEMMCQRSNSRIAFGRPLSHQGSIREDIATSAAEIEQSRLLTLAAAKKMDKEGNKAARDVIAMAKITAPSMAQRVLDRAIQIHGAMGVSQDTFLAAAWGYARTIRIADGPDQVHMHALAKQLISQYGR